MKPLIKIDLKYCIEAKNADTELEEPCNCYRYYIDVAYNFKAYRISFCKHWKDFLYNQNADVYFGRNYSHRIINEVVIKTILEKAGIETDGSGLIYGQLKEPTLVEIKYGDIYFFEPVFVKNNRHSYDRIYFYNIIKPADFFKTLINSLEYELKPDQVIDYYNFLNPFHWETSPNIHSAYDNQLEIFRKKIEMVNKKISNRKKVPICDDLLNIIKLTIKEKKNETSKH